MFTTIGALITSVINSIKTAFCKNASGQVADQAITNKLHAPVPGFEPTAKNLAEAAKQFDALVYKPKPKQKWKARLSDEELRPLTNTALMHGVALTNMIARAISDPEKAKAIFVLDPLVARPNANDILGGEVGFYMAYHTYVKTNTHAANRASADFAVALGMLRDALIAAALLRGTDRERILRKLRTSTRSVTPVANGLPQWVRDRATKVGERKRLAAYKRNRQNKTQN